LFDEKKGYIYPCCDQEEFRFDPSVPPPNGCRRRTHVVSVDCDVFKKFCHFEHNVDSICLEDFSYEGESDEQNDATSCEDSETESLDCVPEHRKRPTDGLTLFEMKISPSLRRDMLRQDDKRRSAELVKWRAKKLCLSKRRNLPETVPKTDTSRPQSQSNMRRKRP